MNKSAVSLHLAGTIEQEELTSLGDLLHGCSEEAMSHSLSEMKRAYNLIEKMLPYFNEKSGVSTRRQCKKRNSTSPKVHRILDHWPWMSRYMNGVVLGSDELQWGKFIIYKSCAYSPKATDGQCYRRVATWLKLAKADDILDVVFGSPIMHMVKHNTKIWKHYNWLAISCASIVKSHGFFSMWAVCM